MNILAKKIKYYKVQLGLTTADISKKTGLPENTIARICSGRTKDPKLGTLKLLAQAFECDLDDLLINEDEVQPYYLDKKTGELSQRLKENSKLKTLFDELKNLNEEELNTFIGIVNILKKK